MNKEKFFKIILSALGILLTLFVVMVAFYTGAQVGAMAVLVPLCKFIVGYIFGWGASKIVLDKIWGDTDKKSGGDNDEVQNSINCYGRP